MKRISTTLPMNHITRRAHAVAQQTAAPGEWLVQRLGNGAQVACALTSHTVSPVQLSAIFRAGSRHENHANEAGESGMTHLLRRSLGLRTEGATGFGTVRSLQQMGASVECSASRELLTYQIRLSNPKFFHDAVRFVGQSSSASLFLPWELSRVIYPYLRKDLDFLYRSDFEQLLVELLHKAAYRSQGLSHSVYAPKFAVQRGFSESALVGYQSRFMSLSRLTLVATASDKLYKDAGALMKIVQAAAESDAFSSHSQSSQGLEVAPQSTVKSSVVSDGDARYDLPQLEKALVAVAWEGLPLGHKDEVVLAVLLSALDGGRIQRPRAAWSTTSNSGTLSKSITAGQESSMAPSAVIGSLLYSYSDSGLVGFELVGNRDAVRSSLPKAWNEIKRVGREGISEEQLTKAKTWLKSDLLFDLESPFKSADHVGEELALTGNHTSQQDILAKLDGVTRSDVERVANTLFGAKSPSSMAAVGDIHELPYLNDLKI